MKPTYTTIEVLRMIPNLNTYELKILSEILTEEKQRYCLVDLELIGAHYVIQYLKIKKQL